MAKYFFATVFLVMLFGMFVPKFQTNNTDISIDRNSPEYRYARTRLKMEGFGAKESTQAADAIYKFHKAQQYKREME